jgi:excisionase family DNA binding protein
MGEAGLQAYSVKRAALLMGCTPRHVYNLIEAGELEAFLIGKRGMRVRAAEIDRWQRSKTVSVTRKTATSLDVEVTSMSPTMERAAAASVRR